MTKFTASNGYTFERVSDPAELIVRAPGAPAVTVNLHWPDVAPFREFFQHEKDIKLGRWRWPEHPSYVVYPGEFDEDGVLVLFEPGGGSTRHFRTEPTTALAPSRAARAYFDAHPRHPWQDAKLGEVWVVEHPPWISATTPQPPIESVRTVNTRRRFVDVTSRFSSLELDDPQIVSARRIYPEGDQ